MDTPESVTVDRFENSVSIYMGEGDGHQNDVIIRGPLDTHETVNIGDVNGDVVIDSRHGRVIMAPVIITGRITGIVHILGVPIGPIVLLDPLTGQSAIVPCQSPVTMIDQKAGVYGHIAVAPPPNAENNGIAQPGVKSTGEGGTVRTTDGDLPRGLWKNGNTEDGTPNPDRNGGHTPSEIRRAAEVLKEQGGAVSEARRVLAEAGLAADGKTPLAQTPLAAAAAQATQGLTTPQGTQPAANQPKKDK